MSFGRTEVDHVAESSMLKLNIELNGSKAIFFHGSYGMKIRSCVGTLAASDLWILHSIVNFELLSIGCPGFFLSLVDVKLTSCNFLKSPIIEGDALKH